MEEETAMYLSDEYKKFREACDIGESAQIKACLEELQKGYGLMMLKRELGTLEHILSIYAKD